MKNKILLIEDDAPTIDLYKLNLEKAGFNLEIIKWGKEAMERIGNMEPKSEQKPDLILLDMILPDMNGIEILKEIRNKEATSAIPVLILTNYSDQKLEEASSALKAEGYLLKTSHTPKEIINAIKKILRKK
jgi:two-component system, OmpR family, alkaline phosphatase synthesis response regulator PhoP